MELDHVILFVAGAETAARMFPGCALDPGRRHDGQGTRNRRVLLERSYIEVLWIDDPEAERRTGLGFGPRCAPAAACPFGAVLRGTVPEPDRGRYVPYQVPAGGPALLLLDAARSDPGQPFLAVWEAGDRPQRGVPPPLHPCGARAIRRAIYCSRVVPDLGSTSPRDVVFEAGEARLRLDVDGLDEPWVLAAAGR